MYIGYHCIMIKKYYFILGTIAGFVILTVYLLKFVLIILYLNKGNFKRYINQCLTLTSGQCVEWLARTCGGGGNTAGFQDQA